MVRFKRGSGAVTIEEKAHRRPLFRRIAWTLGHLVSGVAICSAVMWAQGNQFQEPDESLDFPPPLQMATEVAEHQSDTTEFKPLDQLNRADDLLRAGSYAAALRIYGELNASQGDGDTTLIFRRALCLERMGEPDRALELYQTIVQNSPIHRNVINAQLGQARAWWRMGQQGPARSLLFSLVIESPSREGVIANSLHLLANLAVEDAFASNASLMDEQEIVVLHPLSDLEWLSSTTDLWQDEPPANPSPTPLRSVDRFGSDLTEIRLTMQTPSTNAASLLQEIAHEAQLELTQSSSAKKVLRSRSIAGDVRDIDLATWLDGVLEPIGLVWEQELETVRISLVTEIAPERVRQLRRAQAKRLCESALALFPEDRLAPATLLTLGNILFWNGDYEGASNFYHDLVRRATDGHGLRAAWFNLSRAAAMQSDFDTARQALFKCVDLSRGHPNEALCYLFLGRYFLDDGQSESAIRQLVRAISLARDDTVKQNAVETLACAYLIANNPEAANMALMEHRELLRKEPHLSKAGFLSAVARYRAASHPLDRVRSGRAMANSLSHVDASRFFCFAAYGIVADSYEELGLPNQVKSLLVEALHDVPPNDVHSQLKFRLGEFYADDGRFDEAKTLMNELMADGKAPWPRRANLQLAKSAFRQREIEQCLLLCRDLLQTELPDQDKATILKLMGRVYEQKSEHYKAALCFAGLVPTSYKDAVSPEVIDDVTQDDVP